jgi:hypothetical protein
LHGGENDELTSTFGFGLHRESSWNSVSISPLPWSQLDRSGATFPGPGQQSVRVTVLRLQDVTERVDRGG